MLYSIKKDVGWLSNEDLFERSQATLDHVLCEMSMNPPESEWGRGVRERVRSLVNMFLARRGEYAFSLSGEEIAAMRCVNFIHDVPPGYHMRLPWKCDGWTVQDPDGNQVCWVVSHMEFAHNRKANAVFITQACNSHHVFMSACARAVNALEDKGKAGIQSAIGMLRGALNSVLTITDSYFYEEKSQLTFNDYLVKNNRKKVSEFACAEIENAA